MKAIKPTSKYCVAGNWIFQDEKMSGIKTKSLETISDGTKFSTAKWTLLEAT